MPFKSHHYNPQVYLRQFVNPKNKKELWEYDLGTGAVKLSSPKKSGCEDYYHSIVGKDGARDDKAVEESFSVIENRLPGRTIDWGWRYVYGPTKDEGIIDFIKESLRINPT